MERGLDATVLVVDDEEPVRETYAAHVEAAGYDVRTADGGTAAIEAYDDGVDVVLLDRRMPDLSGDEVLAAIRNRPDRCRVVMVSAVEPGSDIVEMPIDDYLTKPVSGQEITAAVDQVLQFDRYESLLNEYYSLVRKTATLRTDRPPVGDDRADLEALASRRETIRTELAEVVDSFEDEAVAETIRRMGPIPS